MTIAATTVLLAVAQVAYTLRPMEQWLQQPYIDAQAQQSANAKGNLLTGPSELMVERVAPLNPKTHPWRPVSDAFIRSASGYWAPKDYRFHKSVDADMDRDGRPDLVELVENGKQGAIRITYGARGKASRIVACEEQLWSGAGLFSAGNAVMINYPESRLYFLFQRGDEMRARFIGD
jgi:hypothetical protein